MSQGEGATPSKSDILTDILDEVRAIRRELRHLDRQHRQQMLDTRLARNVQELGHDVSYDPATGFSTNVPGCYVDVAGLKARGSGIGPHGNIVLADDD